MQFEQKKSDLVAQKLCTYTYRENGRGAEGADCIGIVILFLKEFGITIPDSIYLKDWKSFDVEPEGVLQRLFRKLGSEEPLTTGDVIAFFRGSLMVSSAIDTLGIFLGDGRFIHAGLNFDSISLQMSLMPRFGVYFQSLTEEHWLKRLYGVYRVRGRSEGSW
jgi:cell wall-associated NlpC family hydrolase